MSWERLATADPERIVFRCPPRPVCRGKIAVLRTNSASRNLKAVQENRFVSLPDAMWLSSPLNIGAAATLRHVLERHGLVPRSDTALMLHVQRLNLAGSDWLGK